MASVSWHDSGLPSWLAPRLSFSFYEQAVIEIPAPYKYQVAQEFRHMLVKPFGPEWEYEIAKEAHKTYLRKRPWWITL